MQRRFLEQVFTHLPEVIYYSDHKTESTFHATGARHAQAGSWTEEFVSAGHIPAPADGKVYKEFERTLTALYCFYLTTQNGYQEFIEAQKEDILKSENFAKLCNMSQQIIADADSKTILQALIVYSDLGKTPAVKKLAGEEGINKMLDPDDLLVEILKLSDEKLFKILPSFSNPNHNENVKQTIKEIYPIMTACFGHLHFLEDGQLTLRIIADALLKIPTARRAHALDLVFLAQFFDGAGSQGQMTPKGSVTCNEDFYLGYMLMLDVMRSMLAQLNANVARDTAVENAFQDFLVARGQLLGWVAHNFEEEQFHTLVRLGCMLRGFEPEFGELLLNEFVKLPQTQQDLLVEQLNFKPKGLNSLMMPPHYVATTPQNISYKLFAAGNREEGVALALKSMVCFSYIIKAITTQHAVADLQIKISFGELAFLADTKPKLFLQPEKLAQTFMLDLTRNKIMPLLPTPHKPRKIKNLIFDLGHVFIEIDIERKKVYEAFSKLAKQYGITLSAEAVEAVFTAHNHVLASYHRGSMSSQVFRNIFKSALGLPDITNEEFYTAWTASILGKSEVVRDRLTYLQGLRALGYKVFLLSNNNELHCDHTRLNYAAAEWDGKYFDKQYYSHLTGNYKPEAQAFQQVITENNLHPAETMFFDDIPENVIAARKYGLWAGEFTVHDPVRNIEKLIAAAVLVNSMEQSWAFGLWKQNTSKQTTQQDVSSTLTSEPSSLKRIG